MIIFLLMKFELLVKKIKAYFYFGRFVTMLLQFEQWYLVWALKRNKPSNYVSAEIICSDVEIIYFYFVILNSLF